jgi:hypothetical protein
MYSLTKTTIMKKIYLCAMALSVGSLSFGQSLTKKSFSEDKQQRATSIGVQTTNNATTVNNKAPGDVIWTDDFSDISTWTLTNSSSPTQDWIYTTDLTVLGNNNVLLTSGANGFIYIDSDALGGTSTQNITAETVNSIDCSTNSNVTLTWEQDIVSFYEVFTVSVSGDNGGTWTDYIIAGGTGQARVYETKILNITAVAANMSNVKVKFNYQGDYDWMWAIDDVALVETQINDIETEKGFYGFFGVQYTRIPYTQVQPMSLSMQYQNLGSAVQTGSRMIVDVNDGTASVFNQETTLFSMPSLSADTLTMDDVWTPSALTADWNIPYTVSLSIESDSVDATVGNNGIVFPAFEVTENIMALDDYSATPGNGGGNAGPNGVTEYEAGNQFDIVNQDETLTAIDLVTGPNTPVGTFIDVVIYQIDFSATPYGYTEVFRSAGYQIVAADIGVVKHFILPTPATLTAGETYFAAVHSFIDYEFGTSGVNPEAGTPAATHSAIRYPSMGNPNANSSFSFSNTPMIRLNFDATVGIDAADEATSFSIYPNPSNGEFTINLSGEAKTVAIAVKNVVGQTIINKTVNVAGNTTETISLSDYSKGVYFLTVDGETTKLIVE